MEEKELIRGHFRLIPIFLHLLGIVLAASTLLAIVVKIRGGEISPGLSAALGIWIIYLPLTAISFFVRRRWSLVVTDSHVHAQVGFIPQRMDLPLDMISMVSTRGLENIAIATSSGMIVFPHLENRDKVVEVISGLIAERQKIQPVQSIVREAPQTGADEIVRYKELLDQGIITQDEFDAKKKQLLGL